MNEVCQVLADTGIDSSTIAFLAIGLVMAGLLVMHFMRRRHIGRAGFVLVALVLAGHLVLATNLVRAATSDCQPATSHRPATPSAPDPTNPTDPVDPDQLSLVNDTYNKDNGFTYTGSPTNEWGGNFDILANDQSPVGDPIDPASIRFSNPSFDFEDAGVLYGDPANTNFDILDGSGNQMGYISLNYDYDIDGKPVYDGTAQVALSKSAPQQTYTIDYTAITKGGVAASHTATISFTNDDPLPPPPIANDDTYSDMVYERDGESRTIGWHSSYDGLEVMANDQAQSGDPLDSISLINPDNGSYDSSYTEVVGEGTITWQVDGSKVTLYVSPEVPYGTPITVQYVVYSYDGLMSNPATITVTLPPAPVFVPDSYSLPASAGTSNSLPILINDQLPAGKTIDLDYIGLGASFDESYYYSSLVTQTIPGDPSGNISWTANNGTVEVSFGANVPLNQPFTIWYRGYILGNGAPGVPTSITVTRDPSVSQTILAYNSEMQVCWAPDADNIKQLGAGDVVSTGGAIDWASLDLDPTTAGRQTSIVTNSHGTITVNDSGLLSVQYGSLPSEPSFAPELIYYTIADSNGAVSNVAAIKLSQNCPT